MNRHHHDFTAPSGVPMRARLVSSGMSYGRFDRERRAFALVYPKGEPVIEFFDSRYVDQSLPLGHFVSRYYATTLDKAPDARRIGLLLDGENREWSVSAGDLRQILEKFLPVSERRRKESLQGLRLSLAATSDAAPTPITVEISDVDHASAVVQFYIREFNLKPPQWAGGVVVDAAGRHYATVAFDGSVTSADNESISQPAFIGDYEQITASSFHEMHEIQDVDLLMRRERERVS